MNNIKDYGNLSSKRVLLRLDLNVPLKNDDIVDETRIIKIIPVIEFLIKRNVVKNDNSSNTQVFRSSILVS